MSGHDIVVIGASAGGVEALVALAGGLPADLPAALFIVLHIPPDGRSHLPQILNRAGPLPACHPSGEMAIAPGHIYIAPPDHHLLMKRGSVHAVRGPRENAHRPAIDPLFRTAARAYGPRVIGVVLSGTLDDGTAGLQAIKERGGLAMVQDPDDALFSGMPASAVANVPVDLVAPLATLSAGLVSLVAQPAPAGAEAPVSEELEVESAVAEFDMAAMQKEQTLGPPSGFTCPECHGTLWELREGDYTHYRCRVGHAYSPDSLVEQQRAALEAALWAALRALEEREALLRRLLERARQRAQTIAETRFAQQAQEAAQQAGVIRDVLLAGIGEVPRSGTVS